MINEKLNIRYHPLLAHIKSRIKRNKNCIIVINGETGSGKTYAGLRLCEDLSKLFGTPFNIKTNVGFEFDTLYRKMDLDSGTPGMCYLFEEVGSVGSGASNKQWQSKANMMFSSFMQTSRHKNQIFVMTCPPFTNLDASARRLTHLLIKMEAIRPQNKCSYAKCYRLKVNPMTGKMWNPFIQFGYKGEVRYLDYVQFGLPSDNILKEYEVEKDKFSNRLRKKILQQMEEEKPSDNAQDTKQMVSVLTKKGVSQKEISRLVERSPRRVRQIQKELREEGENNEISSL